MRPNPGEVHVWSARLDYPGADSVRAAALLSPEERERAGRFRFPRDRRRYIAAHVFLRKLLGEYLDLEPENIRFLKDLHGRPSLDPRGRPGPAPDFNLSHSEGAALCAVSPGIPVGVDIEKIRPDRDHNALVRRWFSAREAEEYLALAERDRMEAFFAAWTRKEALLKAVGGGVTLGLDRFEVSLHPGKPARLKNLPGEAGPARDWTLVDLTVGAGFRAALAVRAPAIRILRFDRRSDPPGDE